MTKPGASEAAPGQADIHRLFVEATPVGMALLDPAGRTLFANHRLAEICGGATLDGCLDAPYRAALRAALADVLRGAAVLPQVLETDVAHGRRWLQLHWSRSELHGGGAWAQVQVLDVTEVRRAQRRLEMSHAELEHIYRTAPIGMCLNDEHLRYVHINQILADINGMPIEAHLGRTIEDIVPEVAPLVVPHQRRVIDSGEPVLGVELRTPAPSLPGAGPKDWRLDVYPLERPDGTVWGCSTLVQDVTERKLAERERARFVEQLLTAQEEERRRIARELHDGTGSALVSLSLGLSRLGEVAGAATQTVQGAQVAELRAIVHRVMEDVSRLAKGLHPGVLDDLGLVAALEQYVQEFSRSHRIAVDFVAEVPELPKPLAAAVYRIVQETLTNVVKHAEARAIGVSLVQGPAEVRVVIEDDGRGIPAPGNAREGLGLRSIRERVALFGGELTVQSIPGGGTTLIAALPFVPLG